MDPIHFGLQGSKHDIFNNSDFRYGVYRSLRNMDHRIIFLPLLTLGKTFEKLFGFKTNFLFAGLMVVQFKMTDAQEHHIVISK